MPIQEYVIHPGQPDRTVNITDAHTNAHVPNGPTRADDGRCAILFAVRLDDVWLRYGGRQPWVLRQVTLSLPPATLATLHGRNGAGKSTLLAAAAGLMRPGRGRIHDRPRRIGWVPERFPTGQPFTVRDYLARMGQVRGLRPAAATAAVDRWAQRLYLTDFLPTRLGEVSKGTAQKVGLAQALLVSPDLLVLDEPWEGLDAQTRDLVPAIVAEVVAEGGSVLVSDHLGEVGRLPGSQRWHVADGQVHVEATVRSGRWVVEVALADEDPHGHDKRPAGGRPRDHRTATRMSALIRMRLAAYVRAQYVLAPSLAGLGLLAILYGGGQARADEAYGVSALVLFPVLAWQVKILLDAEPDSQRRLARVSVGSAGREVAAGLIAAAVTAGPTVLAALALPWLFGSIAWGGTAPTTALAVGLWTHVVAVVGALGLGAWASRAIARRIGPAVSILVGGSVLTVVLGLGVSPAQWLVPPMMAVARFGASAGSSATALWISAWALAWSAVTLSGYWLLRRSRA